MAWREEESPKATKTSKNGEIGYDEIANGQEPDYVHVGRVRGPIRNEDGEVDLQGETRCGEEASRYD